MHTKFDKRREQKKEKKPKWKDAKPIRKGGRRRIRLDGDVARRLYERGASDKELAEIFSVAIITIKRWRYRNGLLRR